MSSTIYEQLLSPFLSGDDPGVIIECALGRRSLAVETSQGIGMTYVTDEAALALSRMNRRAAEEALRGRRLAEILPLYLEKDPLLVCIALAAVNSLCICSGEPDEDTWFDRLHRHKRFAMIGFFAPLMDRVGESGVETVIFELRDIPGAHSPEEAPVILPRCDAVLITGSTFANKTFDFYLPHIAPDADAFIFGHSTPLSDALVTRFCLGSVQILDKDAVFSIIRQGESTRSLKPYVRKVQRKPACWRR